MLLSDDGTVVLADFELSRECRKSINGSGNNEVDEEPSTSGRYGTKGFMAPEVFFRSCTRNKYKELS